MPIPPLVASGQLIAASHINAIRNQLGKMTDGGAGAPGLAFEDDPDTGIYRSGTNTLAISAGGTGRVTISASAVTLSVPLSLGGQALSGVGAISAASITISGAASAVSVTASGALSAASASITNGAVDVAYGSLATVIGTEKKLQSWALSGANSDEIHLRSTRVTDSDSGWESQVWTLQRVVDDAAFMGYVQFREQDVVIGTGLNEGLRVNSSGNVSLRIGGTIRTLTVDGSGFVKVV